MSRDENEQSKINYFIDRTDERLQNMDKKIDDLFKFKFIWTGIVVALNALLTIFLTVYLKH